MKTNIIEINNAHYLSNYKIEILFNYGRKRIIDLNDFLKKAKNPMTRKYLNINIFKNSKLSIGIWYGEIMKCAFQYGICMKEKYKK